MSFEEDDGVPNVDNMHLQLNVQDAGSATATLAPISPVDGSRTSSDDHCHGEELPADNVARNQLIAVSILCFLFMIGEITGGLLAGSLAIATDATHMASDLASFLISLFAIWLARKPATIRMSFGYYRAEVVGALISVIVIWIMTGVLVYLAVHRIVHGDYEIGSKIMLITAAVGVVFNILMGAVLHGGLWKGCHVESSFGHNHSHGGDEVISGHAHHHHGHGHGHNHAGELRGDAEDDELLADHRATASINAAANATNDDDLLVCHSDCEIAAFNQSTTLLTTTTDSEAETATTAADRHSHSHPRHTNINVRAAAIHVIGDLIQSIGVLVASIIIHVRPDLKIVDPICTFLFSFLVLCTTINVMRDVLLIMMEGVPRGVDYRAIKQDLEALEGVKTAHSLNVWALTVGRLAVAVHLAVDDGVQWPDTLARATTLLRTKYHVHQSTVQVEYYDENAMSACVRCQNP